MTNTKRPDTKQILAAEKALIEIFGKNGTHEDAEVLNVLCHGLRVVKQATPEQREYDLGDNTKHIPLRDKCFELGIPFHQATTNPTKVVHANGISIKISPEGHVTSLTNSL